MFNQSSNTPFWQKAWITYSCLRLDEYVLNKNKLHVNTLRFQRTDTVKRVQDRQQDATAFPLWKHNCCHLTCSELLLTAQNNDVIVAGWTGRRQVTSKQMPSKAMALRAEMMTHWAMIKNMTRYIWYTCCIKGTQIRSGNHMSTRWAPHWEHTSCKSTANT